MRPSTYKQFPPPLGQIQVPCSTRQAALSGMTLYAPCRTRALLLHHTLWHGVRLFGPKVLPGRPSKLELPVPKETWEALRRAWRERVGEFDEVALYSRLQSARPGFLALLIQDGHPLAFLKCRPASEAEFRSEQTACQLVASAEPTAFHAPPVIGSISAEGWTALAFEPLAPEPHRPLRGTPSPAIFEQIGLALGALSRSPQIPEHWTPSHGDCTPWNLRTTGQGTPILIDWERADWAPPGADQVLYAATAAAVLGTRVPKLDFPEAVDHCRRQFEGGAEGKRDARLHARVLEALEQMETE